MVEKNQIVRRDQSIIDVMKAIDENGKRMALVAEDERLIGIVSDGDIRRHILNSGNLNESVDHIMNQKPIVMIGEDKATARSIFEDNKINVLPVVDNDGKLLKVLFLEDVLSEKIVKNELRATLIVIMAGGRGTRLYPYTKVLPKPLIPIGDKPIVERIIDKFYDFGAKEFYMSVNYRKNMIKAYFSEIKRDYSIDYIEENIPLGTCGSLYFLKNKLQKSFIVSNCDILIDGDYSNMLDYHKKNHYALTIITSVKTHQIPYGIIELDEKKSVKNILEKPTKNILVNTGMYILEPFLLDYIPKGEVYHMTDLINEAIKRGEKIGTYPIGEKAWMDMGQIGELENMRKRLEYER